jgi:TolB-like protein/tetratricopeptide (TPR) repeat protein
MAVGGGERIRFASFEFDVQSGVLHKAGKALRLQPQPARILHFLLTNPGKLVTREQLRQQIWGASTYVDFEHNLNFGVRQIRAALRDNPKKPRFIETLPRRGYRFVAPVIEVRAQNIRSLAVLPLENLSGDPDQEFFADGFTDELITELAKISALRVVSRTSVQRFKRARLPLSEIVRQLDVDALVEGTILRSEQRVRITAQLIDVRKDKHLWSDSYERDLRDVLKLQAAVADAIAVQIHVTLTSEEQSRLSTAPACDPAAHEAYLRGRYFWNKRTEECLVRAKEYFVQAIDKDPGYALAYSGLADTYFYCGYVFGEMQPRAAMPKAKAAALKALELDPMLAEAHVSLALVRLFFDWDFDAAQRAFETALSLNPNYPTAHHAYAAFLAITGNLPAAIETARGALAIDPLSVPIHNILGEMLMFSRFWDQAIEQFRRGIELDPNASILHENLATVLQATGRYSEAVEELLIMRSLRGATAEHLAELRAAYEQSGLPGFRSRQLASDLEGWRGSISAAFHIAAEFAELEDAESAIHWLENLLATRSGLALWIKLYPQFRRLHLHPRFQAIAREVGLP